MKALVVYSSRTGNTRKIAEAIAAVLPGCEIHPVESAPAPEGYDLVAVGYWVDKGMPDAQAVRACENMKNELQTYENNLGFLTASSKKGNSLLTELNRKVEKLKGDIELVKQKIKVIDNSINEAE